jgi:hypothetical protein
MRPQVGRDRSWTNTLHYLRAPRLHPIRHESRRAAPLYALRAHPVDGSLPCLVFCFSCTTCFMNIGRAQPLGVTASHYAFPASTGMVASLILFLLHTHLPSLSYLCPIGLSWPAIDSFSRPLMYILTTLLCSSVFGGYLFWLISRRSKRARLYCGRLG